MIAIEQSVICFSMDEPVDAVHECAAVDGIPFIDIDSIDVDGLLEGVVAPDDIADMMLESFGESILRNSDVENVEAAGLDSVMEFMMESLAALQDDVKEHPTNARSGPGRGGYRWGVPGGKRQHERGSTSKLEQLLFRSSAHPAGTLPPRLLIYCCLVAFTL